MSMGTTLEFDLPQDWTVRKVAVALAREWLLPFRTEPVVKKARWIVQPVVEGPGQSGPLWEPGISTQEYEERMERTELNWAVRASFGRGRVTVLARFEMNQDDQLSFRMECNDAVSLPETLFDAEKLNEFLTEKGTIGTEGLFTALLTDNGFRLTAV